MNSKKRFIVIFIVVILVLVLVFWMIRGWGEYFLVVKEMMLLDFLRLVVRVWFVGYLIGFVSLFFIFCISKKIK